MQKKAKKMQNMLKLHMQNIKYGRIQNMQTDANRYRKVKKCTGKICKISKICQKVKIVQNNAKHAKFAKCAKNAKKKIQKMYERTKSKSLKHAIR